MTIELGLSGKVALVTGGARGVGAGIVETFRAAGAAVETCGRSDRDGVPGYTRVDVRDEQQIARWVEEVAERHGHIDIVVNNAGGAPFSEFAGASTRFHRRIVELNFLSAAYVAHAVHPVMCAQDEGGVVLNITSISARRASPGTAVYGAAKAALESLTRSLAVEWAPRVRVNAISAGLVATPGATDHYGDAEQVARIAATIPRGVFATPADVGQACLLLATDLAAHITGAVLNVDGGGEWPAFLQHAPR
ncbi:SDR family oxidoreductase [Amycolatopsis viridis]|uniref:NAD(P)-dependent dehydrogenase (Short-subunit alcohol dehydrogenase family) n=1 Tax=Amycolatopsis viridis TaxID=185678 RepID=A0ABX0SYU7_9PSEU|nr:SDR family oxidoreductase [Amycolatopsis viridis]NIH80819.1 NAD(P)-dependent dehydrogenase (short-subunit alcohol dehydrogenase family) [Amycolatopsis viridis]